ncbi:MAG: AAA family ATPase, partial [Candidatus Poribacteria bacterium]|nr:AAA family ATPase [Candidatus Poribacteria bacterium]
MIRKLEVKGLNKRVNAPLNFNEDLNIITGANGSGKTTLLKLMWYLISGNLQRILLEIPFDFVSIVTDSFSLTMTHLDVNKVEFVSKENIFSESVDFTVTVDIENGNLEEDADIEKLKQLNTNITNAMKSSLFFPTFRRIEGGFSTVSRRYISGDSSRIRRMYVYHPSGLFHSLQESMSELSDGISVEDHKFIASISTDDVATLLKQKYDDISRKIDERQVKLSRDITRKIENYFGNETETKARDAQDAIPVLEDIRENVDQVTQTREDLLKPFSVLASLTQEILKYKEISVAEWFSSNERTEGITLGKGTEGIVLGVASEAISSDKLSSGEKQMLSFLSYNAFYNNTPIFIDEPELSLHIDWQRLLLPTLLDQ